MKDKVIVYDGEGKRIETTLHEFITAVVEGTVEVIVEEYLGKVKECNCGGKCERK